MKTPVSTLGPSVALLAGLVLAGCANKADRVPCPPITAPVDTISAFQTTDEAGALIDMRFNGVSAACEVVGTGDIRMDVAIGMKLKRVDGEAVDDVVSITVGTAVVDADNAVVANDRIVYRAGIAKEDGLKYPVIDYRVTVNSDHRLVISLLPAP
ncbi:MAG: hypothetical protein L7W95_08915 [Alphaproteobacteria bacterium]|jgi:hypothetical protein|nr:hypothetical protein [Alphaproteobacteria bacterium]